MNYYFRERFHVQQNLICKASALIEVNEIIEMVRDELRSLIPNAMEVCILLIDPDAVKYTRPLQCALYQKPVDCQSCKRDRPAVQRAINRKKAIVVAESEPIRRLDQTLVAIGSECAIPVFVEERVVAAVSVVIQPLTRFSRRDFYLIRDASVILGTIILSAKRHWEVTQEKIAISRTLSSISPFVPESVRYMAQKDPNLLTRKKEHSDVTVLFLDLEGYTSLADVLPEAEVNTIVEKMLSSFVDPIHRSHGDINETAGDGFMILFKNHDPRTNAINSVKAAFEIMGQNRFINESLPAGIPPIHVNIGINSGMALLGMTRFSGNLDTRMTYTATGSVTNIAARLSDYAKKGDILIGESTKSLIGDTWPVYPLGELSLKGLTTPLPAFSLIRAPGEIV
ncbi:MAG TPA: guanylate cyclase [Desulfobacteraceae bacterium]|nr:guanylate cyclase [Desulfobacteraceae bacterium]